MPPSLSVLIPVYNEAATLERVLTAVDARPEVAEIVVVDDGSTDATAAILDGWTFEHEAKVVRHAENRGKGAAVRTAIEAATKEVALIQDADLEYDPEDYGRLLDPFDKRGVSVVYGARTFAAHSAYSFWFVIGNKLVALWTNVLFDAWVSDVETCYKLMPLHLWRSLDLRSSGFAVEAEITSKLLKRGHRIFEVPISYMARSREEGKKLTWRDGFEAIWTIARIRFG